MKAVYCSSLVAWWLAASSQAQPQNYSVIERGPHHSVMASVTWTTNPITGKTFARTNCYTALATGMNRLQDNRWVPASTEIEVVPGGAIARNAAYTVSFAANLSVAGAVDCTTPDGKRLRSTILGLSYFDAATGDSVLIAELKDSAGELLPSGNQVIYPAAFTNLEADVLYTYTRAGLEQCIILREQPPSPAEFGLDPRTTRLEVLTEFLDPPIPAISTAVAPSRAARSSQGTQVTAASDPPLTDQTVSFGAMQLRRGKAFMLGDQTNSRARIAVGKSWQTMDGRTVLVEQVKYPAIQPQVEALPAPAAPRQDDSPGQGALLRVSPHRLLPPVRMAVHLTNSLLLARSSTLGKGLVLDYDLSGSQTNFTFQADTTYHIVGPVYLSGLTRIEGGSVIKYPAGEVSLEVVGDGAVECLTAAYRPATFTAADDDSIGTAIAGSTGTPTNYYGSVALDLWAVSCPAVSNVNFSYLSNALAGEGITLRDAQMIRCYSAFAAPWSKPSLYNVLIYRVNTLVDAEEKGWGGDDLTAENVTAHYCTNLMADQTSVVRLTNCLFASVGGWQCPFIFTNSTIILASDSGVFQTVGAAGHYLAPDSPYRNVGTTNISAALLAGLRRQTTYPPLVFSNVLLSADTTFTPQAQRDTDIPDLGYHYDPLDYLFKYVRATNSTVRLLPGTAIATAGPYGIGVLAGSQLISEGAPTSLNHIARYNLVQECSTTNWTGKGGSVFGNWLAGLPAAASFRFTDWSMPAKDGSHLYACWQDMVNSCRDCQFHGGQVQILYPTPHLTNCLLERVDFLIDDDLIGEDVSPIVRNCLFLGGTLTLNHDNSDTWLFRDNLFDQTSIVLNIYGSDIDGAYNGYTPGSNRLMPTNAYDIVASINYDTGPLGNYYQPTDSPLIDAGSTTADQVGLAPYTVLTDQLEEGTTRVDIGFHYAAFVPPSITTQPASETVGEGATVQFSVVATSAWPLAYQWYLNGLPLADGGGISGSQSASLVLDHVQHSQAGNYYVVVSTWAGSTTSETAGLSVGGSSGMWVYTGSLNTGRGFHTAALLTNGQVLVAGGWDQTGPISSTELYNPTNGIWTVTGPMNTPRAWFTATLLTNGQVLVAGGYNQTGAISSTELYNPANGIWTVTGAMNTPRAWFTATLLTNGQVLVTGGIDGQGHWNATAELYNPASGTWTLTGSLQAARQGHTATLLTNGQVVVAGGTPLGAERYDPVTGTWTAIGSLHARRDFATATLLANGQVLVAGGYNGKADVCTAELYNPIDQTWTVTGSLNYGRGSHVAGLLPNGQVLVAGGEDAQVLASAELYDPATGTWRITDPMNQARTCTILTLLTNGQVLVAGGSGALSSAEIYTPSSSPAPVITSQPQSQTVCPGSTATFEVSAVGAGPFSYRWMKDGANLADGGNVSGAATATLTLTAASTTDTGGYNVTVGNGGGAVNSAVATLALLGAPTINTQAFSQTVFAGDSVPFSVGVGGGGSAAYQWYFNTQALSDGAGVSGSQTATLMLRDVQQSQQGNYYVVVSTCGGSTTSSTATLTIGDTIPGPWPWLWWWSWPGPGPGPGSATWTYTAGSQVKPTEMHTATLLGDGKVLVVFSAVYFSDCPISGYACDWSGAGAELYDPATGTWASTTHPPTSPGFGNAAALLPSGQVLVAGGGFDYPLSSAQIYTPSNQSWASTTTSMNACHCFHTATPLSNGQVLVAGGCGGSWDSTAIAELFNPGNGTWTVTNSMHTARALHTATLLGNGKVMVAGGGSPPWRYVGLHPCGESPSSSAELYDPGAGAWVPTTGPLNAARCGHVAILLPSGKVLVAGGYNGSAALSSAELYDPVTGTWTNTGSLNIARCYHAATLLPCGKVLVAGGYDGSAAVSSAELYDPATETWSMTATMNAGRCFSTMTLLNNGKALVAGGGSDLLGCSSSAELYSPASPPPPPPFTIWITEPKANANLP